MNIEDLYTADRHTAGKEMQLMDEFGNLIDLFITTVGIDSPIYKDAALKMRRAIIEGDDPEDARQTAASECILDWRGFESKDKTIEFDRKTMASFFKKAPYILDQYDLFLAKRVNFTSGKDAG